MQDIEKKDFFSTAARSPRTVQAAARVWFSGAQRLCLPAFPAAQWTPCWRWF